MGCMTSIATYEAKPHLSRYLKRVQHRETIVIMRGLRPMAKPVPYDTPATSRIPKVGETMDERFEIPDSASEPLSGDELKEWGCEGAAAVHPRFSLVGTHPRQHPAKSGGTSG